MVRKVFFILLVLGLSACHSIGPKQVKLDRNSYNQIIRETDFQQLLTNIVLVSYLEPPSYLKITNVMASYSLSNSVSSSNSWTLGNNGDASMGVAPTAAQWQFGLSPSVSYSDSPTITYVPIDDATYISLLQTPISFSDLSLLFSGGIDDMELYCRLIFNKIGPLDNASSLTSPLVIKEVQYEPFYEFLKLFVRLLRQHAATISQVSYENNSALQYQFNADIVRSAEAIKMKKLLKIPLDSTNFILSLPTIAKVSKHPDGNLQTNTSSNPPNLVIVQTRSIYGIMSYLAHAVQIPAQDIELRLTQQVLNKNGDYVDFRPLMANLMTIYSSDTEPKNVFVKSYVKGHWFYIKASDIYSKATFNLLLRLMIIIGGLNNYQNGGSGPLLTVPVGG
jgi:hypothetical protein